MKLGVFTPLFANLSLDELLIRAQQAGLSVLEIGSGGNPGSHHCPVNHLLESENRVTEMQSLLLTWALNHIL